MAEISSQITICSQTKSSMAPYLAATLTILIWGAMPIVTRIAVEDMDPLAAGIMRTMLAGLIVLPFVVRSNFPRPQNRSQWIQVVLVALCGFVGFTLLFSLGSKLTSVTHTAVINSSIPLFSGLFGVLAVRVVPKYKWFLGMSLSFLGVIFIIVSQDNAVGETSLTGDILCLLSSISVGLGYVWGSRLSVHMGALAVTFWAVLIAALLQIPLLLYVWDINDVLRVSIKGWAALAYLSIGASLLAYVAWYWALSKGGVTKIAPMQFLMPVVSLPLAVIVFGETLTMALVMATVAIVAGVYLSRKG